MAARPVPHPVPESSDERVSEHVAAAARHTLVLLWAGPSRDQPPAEAEQIQGAHLRHLVGLMDAGALVVNGPVLDDASDLRGLSIYGTDDGRAVREWVEADPAVSSGRLRAEILPWFGELPER